MSSKFLADGTLDVDDPEPIDGQGSSSGRKGVSPLLGVNTVVKYGVKKGVK